MLSQTIWSRSRKIGLAVLTVIATTILFIYAAGSNAAVFSFGGAASRPESDPLLATVRSAPDTPETACATAPSGMIGWWPGDGTTNDILAGQHGIPVGNLTYGPGRVSQAFSLDGDGDFVNLALPTVNTQAGSDVSVDFWMYWDGTFAWPGEMVFGFYEYDLYIYGDSFGFNTAQGDIWGIPNADLGNRWVHVAAIFRNGNARESRLFIDGVERQLTQRLGNTANGQVTTSARIGGWLRDDAYSFPGRLDEVHVYNGAITAADFAAIYSAGNAGICRVECVPSPSGLVGWWPGDGNGFDVKGLNNMTPQNGGGFTSSGRVSGAFNFQNPPGATSGQFAASPSATGLPVGNAPRTVNLWLRTQSDLSSATESAIFNYGTQSTGQNFGLITSRNAAGKLYFYGNGADLFGTTTILPNTWYFASVTYDGTTVRLYVNGQEEASGAFALNTVPNADGTMIGLRPGSSVWNGQIDEVEIYNRVLLPAEIQAIYAAGAAGKCRDCGAIPRGMVGWWPGENNPDDVQRSNHGTRVNGGAYDPGQVGQSFGLNQASQQYISLPPATDNLLSNTAGAITVWVNPSAVGDFDMIAAFGSGGPGQAIGLGIQNNVRVYHQGDAYDWVTSTPVTPGIWTYLAYTWDETTESVYKNGILAESRARGTFSYVPGTNARIGYGFINDPSVFFTGRIDELSIYDRALDAAEIARAYHAGSSGICRTCSTRPDGPISWWRGENNAEDVVGNNFGALVGGANFAPGIVGNAFSLNGTSAYVRIPDSSTLDVTTGFTLGAWVKPNAIPTYPSAALVMSKIGPASNLNGYQMALSRISDQNRIWCGFNQAGGPWPQHTVSGGNVPVGEWTYVSCTFDNNTLAVQKNGAQVGSTVIGPATVVNTSSSLRIGSDDVGQQFFSGLIDEPMIYGRALNDAELGQLSESGARGLCRSTPAPATCAPQPPGMLSWWRATNDAFDRKKRHHGTVLPGTTYAEAKTGRGFEFNNASQGVDLGNWFNLQTFSIELWVKANASQVQYSDIIDNNHSSGPRRSWAIQNADSGNRFEYYSFDFAPDAPKLYFDLVPGLWHHLVVTRDQSRVTRGYLNRSFAGSVTTSTDIPYDGSQNLRIGNWYGGGRPFNGTIDEVTIYDRALNEQEIAALYSADSYGKCAAPVTPSDLDGDMLTDLTIYRPVGGSGSEWWTLRSSTGGNWAATFGAPTDKLVAEDFTGDGKTDVAIYRPSNNSWYILRSEDYSYYSFPFGTDGDIPVPADYDGDGIADPAVYRPSSGTWYIARSTGGLGQERFGFPTDKPVPADYDGDGRIDIAIYRPSNGQWWLNRTNEGLIVHTFGNASDYNVPGDFTGDGKADIAIFRPSDNNWYVLRSEDYSYYSFPFGAAGDIPAAGDFDGDAKFDAAVFRPSDGRWYLRRSTAGVTIIPFGAAGDIPIPGVFIR